jgi:hypothetical protein
LRCGFLESDVANWATAASSASPTTSPFTASPAPAPPSTVGVSWLPRRFRGRVCLRGGWWCGLLWGGDEYWGLGAEGAVLLHDGLRDGRYVIVEEEIVGACCLRERVGGVVGIV